MNKLLTLSLATALCGTFAVAQSSCLATTSSVIGSYTYTATQAGVSGVTFAPPGTTSNTAIGKLISNLNSGAQFASAGLLYFDGAGNVSVPPASSPLGLSTNVGTYTVNPDCTVNVSLMDVFNTSAPSPGVSSPNQATSSLIGFVLGGGSEIDLSQPQSSSSTSGNTPIVSGEFVSRLSMQLIRTFSYGCNVGSLTGPYGLIGTGYVVSGTTTQPVTFFARLHFDGNGNVLADSVTASSPLGSFQYTGGYTVNLDCSGTLTITMANTPSNLPSTTTTTTTTTTATPVSFTGNFVLVPPVAYVQNGTATLTGNAARPGLQFNFSSATQTISGYGRAQ